MASIRPVVRDDVEATEVHDGRVDQLIKSLELTHVACYHQGVAAERLHVGGNLVELLLGPGDDGHVGAGLGERSGAGRADPSSGASDHRHPVGQIEAVQQYACSPLDRSGYQCRR